MSVVNAIFLGDPQFLYPPFLTAPIELLQSQPKETWGSTSTFMIWQYSFPAFSLQLSFHVEQRLDFYFILPNLLSNLITLETLPRVT